MKGFASACGSATIVNAIATGKGAAFALDLRVKAEVELTENSQDIIGDIEGVTGDTSLIERCVENVLKKDGAIDQYGAKVQTSASLPVAVGLSSSSAAANATVLATASALGKELEDEEAINLGIEAAFETGATITGAYDDAAASYYGGGVVTDNEDRELLKRLDLDPELKVLIHLPPEKFYTADTDVERARLLSELVESAHEEALSGNLYGAQTLNGLLYSSILERSVKPALEALDAGALSAGLSGTGPATVAISEKEKVEEIEKRWGRSASEIIVTKPSEEGAKIENE